MGEHFGLGELLVGNGSPQASDRQRGVVEVRRVRRPRFSDARPPSRLEVPAQRAALTVPPMQPIPGALLEEAGSSIQ